MGVRSGNVPAGKELSRVSLINYAALDGAWHRVSIPLSLFAGAEPWADLSRVKDLYTISLVGDSGGQQAFLVDDVAWETGKRVINPDFNSDGNPDIILEDSSGFLGAWFMSGEELISGAYLNPSSVDDAGWRVLGTADFNADSKSDLLFQHTDGRLAVWFLDGINMTSGAFLRPDSSGTDWKAVALGDFNNDGKPDILFQNTDSSLAVWYLNGTTMTSAAMLNPGSPNSASWKVAGAADFNGDGKVDVLFQNTDGTVAVWYMNGVNLMSGEYLTPSNPGATWHVMGVTDQNGDGKPDLLFQNSADASLAVWYMSGSKLILGKMLNPSNAGGTWQIVAP